MATRTVSTKVAIFGESEYRASLSRINTELKALQSSLKLTESQYQNNANSMAALQAKGDALKNLYEAQKKKVEELRSALANAQKAQEEHTRSYEAAKAKIEENNRKLAELKKTTGDTSKEEAALTEQNKKLTEQMNDAKIHMDAAEKGVNSWKTQLNNAEIQLNNLDAEVKTNEKYLDEAKNATDGCAKSIDQYGNEVKEASEETKTMATILASEQLQQGLQKVADALKNCVDSFSGYQAGLAKVRSTTGMSEEEVATLGRRFQELSTEIPVTTDQMLSIAAAAGQFGIKKDQIESFTISMSRLGAASDVSADSVASLLAQFSNITGEKDFERLSSAITRLNYNSATGATEIINMAQGMAAAGKAAGLSAQDILAISAAVTSLGMGSQAGSTAMQRLLIEMQKSVSTGDKLNEFAKISGMSAEEFKVAWGDNAVGALAKFVDGLADTERNGQTSLELLDGLGISSQKEIQALIGLSGAELSLSDALDMVNDEWGKNSALTEAAAIKNETLAAKTQELDSAADNLKIAIGESLAPLMTDLAEKGTDVLNVVTRFVQEHPEMTKAITLTATGVAGLTTAIVGVKTAVKAADFLGLTEPLKAVKAAADLAGGGISGLVAGLGTIAGPAAIAATALAGVVAVYDRIKTSKEIGLLGEGHELEEYAQNVDHYRQEIERVKGEMDELATSGADLTMAYDELSLMEEALRNATEEYTAAQEAANEAQQESVEIAQQQQSTTDAAKVAQEGIKMSLEGLAQSYRQAYDAASDSLSGQIGLFDSFTAQIAEETDTAEKMLDAWGQQTANLAAYTENLKEAGRYGLDQGLVQSLSDGSVQSAGYLQTIITEIQNCANGTSKFADSAEEAVAKFNEAFQETNKAKETLSETMAAIQTDLKASLRELEKQAADVNFEGFENAVNTAFGNVGLDFQEIGNNMGIGLSDGIKESSGGVESAARETVSTANEAAKDEAGEHSPSTVWREIGQNLDEGLKEGIEEGASGVTSAASGMVSELHQAMREGAQEAVTGFTESFSMISDQAQGILTNLIAVIQGTTAGIPYEMYSVGTGIIDGMISGMNSRSGALYSTINSIVHEAIAQAKSAAGVASPSKKTKEIFENVGEGMIVGIESKKDRVAEATADVARNAVELDTSGLERVMQNHYRGEIAVMGMIGDRAAGNGGGSTTINNNFEITMPGMVIREDADIEKISRELGDRIWMEQRRRGQSW